MFTLVIENLREMLQGKMTRQNNASSERERLKYEYQVQEIKDAIRKLETPVK